MRQIARGVLLFAGGLAAAMPLSSFAALPTNVVERHYDRFGRPVGVSLNGERRTEIAYDEATGRIASMRVAGEDEPFRWEYELGSDLKKSLHYPNGALVEREYEPHRDLVTLVSNDVYSSYCYEYDAAGRRVVKNDERYEYNVRGELVGATNAVTGAEFAYCYDDIGNRQWSRELGTNCTYAANELNQYTNVVRGGVAERSAFDLDGNQTNIVTATGEWTVEYNGENRPVLWRRKLDGVTIRMAYDRMGRRVRKNDEMFVYDGYLNVSQTIWDPTEPVATRPLVWRGAGGNAFCFHDGNKDVVDFVPVSSASMARHYDYAPFGEVLGKCVGDVAPWLFSSEFDDCDLGLACYNYRHYDLIAGRWLVRDLINEDGGIGLYLYCANRPMDYFDYEGMDALNLSNPVLPHKCAEAKERFNKWYEEEKRRLSDRDMNGKNWVERLPRCPLRMRQEGDGYESPDPSEWKKTWYFGITQWWGNYHPGGVYELRTSNPEKYGGSGNQCVYDKCGRLITSRPGAGTADYSSPESGRSHREDDVKPFEDARYVDQNCGGESKCVKRYYEVRPTW